MIALFVVGMAAVLIGGAYLINASAVETITSPEDVIEKYVNDPAKYQNFAVESFLNPEVIDDTKFIECEKVDPLFAANHNTRYSGEYTDIVAYKVKYEITYKDEYKHMVTEPSGIKEKLFILIKSDDRWLIDGVGY